MMNEDIYFVVFNIIETPQMTAKRIQFKIKQWVFVKVIFTRSQQNLCAPQILCNTQ